MLAINVNKKFYEWKYIPLSTIRNINCREILLKAAVQVIISYSMSIFLIPKELCKKINKLMQNF